MWLEVFTWIGIVADHTAKKVDQVKVIPDRRAALPDLGECWPPWSRPRRDLGPCCRCCGRPYALVMGEPYGGVVTLDAAACWELLRAAEVGRLAVSVAGGVDIFPINYVVDEGTIVFRTAEGTKLAACIIGPRVAFEADGYDPHAGEAWSVVIKGHAREVQLLDEVPETAFGSLFPWQKGRKDRFVRVVPAQISGRRFQVAVRGAEPKEP
jgi:uncharacterized protein